jgi:biotin carboxyl carrier protein
MDLVTKIQDLVKALEAGTPSGAPSSLTQLAALQEQDLSTVMENTTWQDDALKLQKMIKVESCKSTLAQFNVQLSYGQFGGSATIEGGVGQEETSEYVRRTVPMCFYSHIRRVTDVAKLVSLNGGQNAEDMAAADAAMKISGDIEFVCFRGHADFSNQGVFDGAPSAMWIGPNMHGIDVQVRQSDNLRATKDIMFAEYGADETVVISGGGTLTQENIEDARTRAAIHWGKPDKLLVDPRVLSNYNKIAFNMQRIVLAGSAQDASGANLRKQWVSQGEVALEDSMFLQGKHKPAPPRATGPAAPSIAGASVTDANAVTAFAAGAVYRYYVTSCNELGESVKSNSVAVTIAALGDKVEITITHPGSGVQRYFNVYRTLAGGAEGTQKFIGRVALRVGASTTVFTDLGNKLPGFVTGFLVEGGTMRFKELAPYSRKKLAETEMSSVEAHYRYVTLAVPAPRKNVLIDNLR